MRNQISKTFVFDAAHQLPNHNSKCARLHGHTYSVQVVLRGVVHPARGTADEGMILDFDELTRHFNDIVKNVCDHRFMIQTKNPAVQVTNLLGNGVKVYFGDKSSYEMPLDHVALLPIENTTAECLSEWILEVLKPVMPLIIGVVVHETASSSGEAWDIPWEEGR